MPDRLDRLRRIVPAGSQLALGAWQRRHRWMTNILLAHAAVLTVVLLVDGVDLGHVAFEMLPILAAAAVAAQPRLGRRLRTAAGTLGLVACSALLVHITDGLTESHFHFFVVIAVVTLYQEWMPFALAFLYVVAHHGIVGVLVPTQVYDHAAAWNRPVLWAFIHGGYVALAAAANVVSWRLSEDEREGTKQVLNATGEAMYGVDDRGHVSFANPAMSRLTGWSLDEMHGVHHHMLLGHVTAGEGSHELGRCPVCDDVAAATGVRRGDRQFARRDGAQFPVEYASHPVSASARAEGLVAVVNFQDITQRRAFEDELSHRALHDALTGLANRTLLLQRIELGLSALGSDNDGAVAVVFCDIDRFKRINDSLGHDAGDQLLRQLAERLVGAVRPQDTVARFGGDEFVLCCPDVGDVADAERIGDRLVELLQEPFDLGPTALHVKASFGVAVTSDPHTGTAELIRRSDQAMYVAKKTGGGVRMYETAMAAQVNEQLFMEDELRAALADGQFELYYQPAVDPATDRIVGVEAHIRWSHPRYGVVSPATFIPVAESTGLIVPIGAWVLEQACRQVTAWNVGRATPLTVGVNVSQRQLTDAAFADLVTRALVESGCDPAWLLLEVDEGVLIAALEVVAPALERLRVLGVELGVRVAPDDLGAGSSPLAYLRELPVGVLKVDHSFLTSAGERDDRPSSVSAVVSMARSLSLRTIAEGVEAENERVALSTVGCDAAQGDLYGQPQPASMISPQLMEERWSSGRPLAPAPAPADF